MTIRYKFFPINKKIPEYLGSVVKAFSEHEDEIDSHTHSKLESNDVLAIVRKDLEDLEFRIETGKKKHERISIPVLFGENGKVEKDFYVDGHHEGLNIVLEVEAGRAVTNYQFLKDFFSVCTMPDIDNCVIAVRDISTGKSKSKDFEKVINFFDSMYASRMSIPLKGLLIVGY